MTIAVASKHAGTRTKTLKRNPSNTPATAQPMKIMLPPMSKDAAGSNAFRAIPIAHFSVVSDSG